MPHAPRGCRTPRKTRPHVDGQSIREGLAGCPWEGRLEVLQERPMVVVDGAHNPAGASVLRRLWRRISPSEDSSLVFGVLADKDYQRMLREACPAGGSYHTHETPRGTGPASGNPCPLGSNDPAGERRSLRTAGRLWSAPLRLAGEKDLVCITGSLYLVGETRVRFTGSRKPASQLSGG